MSSSARCIVSTVEPMEPDDAGVVMSVALLVEPVGGENGKGEDNDAEVDEGGVVDGLSTVVA